ncbi:MAG: gluconate 2-dehydrogenase subunit 3 family protein [Ferruginibacter sp.]
MMNRRKALKNIVLASGSLITLPLWMGCNADDTPATHLSSFSSTEQKTIAGIANTLIPAGTAAGSIGALSVGVDLFLQKLIDNCYEKDVQDNVKAQLKALDASAKTIHDNSFAKCTQAQRQELLQKLSTSTNKPEKDFYTLLRSETIRGFNTSKEVMQKYLNYKIAPGHYYGCVEVKA